MQEVSFPHLHSALAKRMQHGQGTSHLPSLPPLCGRFSPHHHHHIIYLCLFFWEAVRKLKEYLWLVQTCKQWQCLEIYGLQNTFKWGSLQRSMPISRGDNLFVETVWDMCKVHSSVEVLLGYPFSECYTSNMISMSGLFVFCSYSFCGAAPP